MKLLGVLPEERRKVSLLLIHYVWVVAVTIAGKSVRDAYFLSRYDKSVLPLMAVAAAIVIAIAIAFFTRVERRYRSNVLVPLGCFVFAASLAALHFRLEGWTIPVLYVWMEVINVISVLQFWLLAAELLDPRQAKRLFPIIGGGGSLAAILIGPQLKPFSKAYGSDTLLWLVCGLLVGAALLGMVTTRLPRVPVIHSETAKSKRTRKRLGSPYVVMISAIVVSAAVVSAIVDYQFKIISSDTLRTETDLVGFFGQFYAATGLSTLLLQFVVAGRAFQRFGVVLVMAVLPFMLGLGSLSILLWPVLWSAVLGKFSDQTFRFTLHNGGLELLWLPVSSEMRREAKPFVSGTLKSVTEGATGFLMYLLLRFLSAGQLSIVSLIFCGLWAGALIKLRALYIGELQSAIVHRRLPPEDLEVSATDALTVRVIDRALLEGDTVQKLFVLGLISSISMAPWQRTLRRLLSEGKPEVKARILQIAGRDETIVTKDALKRLAAESGTEGIEAIRVIGSTGAADLRDSVTLRLEDAEPSIRAAACGALIRLNGAGKGAAQETLNKMLRSGDATERVAALEESSCIDGVLRTEMLEAALKDPSRRVRAKALYTAAAHPEERYARLIAASLSDPALFAPARDALAALPPVSVLPVLTEQVQKQMPTSVRQSSLRAMKICRLPEAQSVLVPEVDTRWPRLADQASDSLLVIARHVSSLPETGPNVESRRAELVNTLSQFNDTLQSLPQSERAVLVRDYLEVSIPSLLAALIRLASLERPETPVEQCIQILHTRDRARLPFVLELLDTLLTSAEREKVSPLLEPSKGPQSETKDGESIATVGWLIDAVYSEDEWLRAIALDYILAQCKPEVAEQIQWERVPETPLIREVTAVGKHRNKSIGKRIPQTHAATVEEEPNAMLTTLEKTILLKSVPLFEDIPGEELSRVAQIAEEKTFPAKSIIFRDGDHADCLYVIVSGSVSIQKGGRELAVLTPGHPFGEMAVLDSSPRSADVHTIEDTTLLRVEQEQFLDIMQSNTQIMQGVVRMLLNRLRKMDEMIVEQSRSGAEKRSV